jgi:hypothetical protein
VWVHATGGLGGEESSSLARVRRVETDGDLQAFKEVYIRAWSIYEGIVATMKANIQRWPELPGWRLYLAEDSRGEPCAVATLFVREGIAYLADAATVEGARGQGAQLALLTLRLREAGRLGLGLCYSRADFGSVSQRNMQRCGPGIQTRTICSNRWKV